MTKINKSLCCKQAVTMGINTQHTYLILPAVSYHKQRKFGRTQVWVNSVNYAIFAKLYSPVAIHTYLQF